MGMIALFRSRFVSSNAMPSTHMNSKILRHLFGLALRLDSLQLEAQPQEFLGGAVFGGHWFLGSTVCGAAASCAFALAGSSAPVAGFATSTHSSLSDGSAAAGFFFFFFAIALRGPAISHRDCNHAKSSETVTGIAARSSLPAALPA